MLDYIPTYSCCGITAVLLCSSSFQHLHHHLRCRPFHKSKEFPQAIGDRETMEGEA